MTARESQLETLLEDLLLCAANSVAQPRSLPARSELRRSVERATAWRRADKAARTVDALAPRDPRPAPPVPEAAPAVADPWPRGKPRLPYAEDD